MLSPTSPGSPADTTPATNRKATIHVSAYIVTWDHIGFLVNLGQQLDLRGVTVTGGYQTLALHDEHDRNYVAAELMAQCRTSVAYRYNEPVNPASNIPTFRGPRSQMRNLAELAQALKWVFCYRYQSCEDPGWPTTFAYHYTERLRVELENRIINCYATTWDYDDGPLVMPPQATRQTEATIG